MSQISKCPKVTVILSYWEAAGKVSKLRYKSILYFSSKRLYCSSTTDISSTFNHFQPLSILEHKNKNKLRYVYDVQNIFKRGCMDVLEFTKPLPVGHPNVEQIQCTL